jgi:alkanesulfonate monooxygenase SsuD/methylene tetrahydromethanopterin reductase-like flavin-dependent oxidoreductase (luciferase family)
MTDGLLFGLNVPTVVDPGADPVAAAVRAEQLGFDFISASDHPSGKTPSFENWTMLCYIAAATSRLRVATRVLGLPYRVPPMIAKMAETLDRLSDGRLILGLGSGHGDAEHRAFGLDVRSPKDKTDGLEEALTIIRGLWTQPDYSFEGRLYRTENAPLEPKPGHRIPIWLGTFAPRSLAITGRLADGWIPSLGHVSGDEILLMHDQVLAAAIGASRDSSEITCVLNAAVRVVDKTAASDESGIVGPPETIVSRLARFADHGFTAFNFILQGPDLAEQAQRLAEEVIPALRATTSRSSA